MYEAVQNCLTNASPLTLQTILAPKVTMLENDLSNFQELFLEIENATPLVAGRS